MASITLNLDDRETLVALIARYGDVGTADKRANLLDGAGLRSFGPHLAPGTTAHDFSSELVRKLDVHGTLAETGEPALVRLLRYVREERVRGREDERAFVDRLLRPYPDFPDVLTEAQRRDVVDLRHRLLACRLNGGDLPPDVLPQAYRVASPFRRASNARTASNAKVEPIGLHAIVVDLADSPPPDGEGADAHPLLTFALYLARNIADMRQSEAQRLSSWAYDAMPRWAPRATRQSLDGAVAWRKAQGHETRLIVRVMPLDNDPGMFKKPRADWRLWLDASLIGALETTLQRVRDATDGPAIAVGDLPGEIERLIDGLVAEHERPDWIEFFLPAALMSLPADQLCCRLPFEVEGRLGSEYKVVVRSWDRAFIPSYLNHIRRQWEDRWALLEKHASADIEADHVRWVEPGPDPVVASGALRLGISASSATTCVAFGFDPVDPDAKLDHGRVIIMTGIPVAVWPRASAAATGVSLAREAIAELLRGAGASPGDPSPPGHLCDAVKRARLAGCSCAGDHLAEHLTLLWDDPSDLAVLLSIQKRMHSYE